MLSYFPIIPLEQGHEWALLNQTQGRYFGFNGSFTMFPLFPNCGNTFHRFPFLMLTGYCGFSQLAISIYLTVDPNSSWVKLSFLPSIVLVRKPFGDVVYPLNNKQTNLPSIVYSFYPCNMPSKVLKILHFKTHLKISQFTIIIRVQSVVNRVQSVELLNYAKDGQSLIQKILPNEI